MCRSNSVWYFFNRPTPTSLLSEHLSRHLPTYETVPSGPRAWTYLPLPPSEGGVSSDRDFARRLARQRRWLVPAWSAQPACQPAAAARRAAQARRRARPRPATTPGSALRPRLRPANSQSGGRGVKWTIGRSKPHGDVYLLARTTSKENPSCIEGRAAPHETRCLLPNWAMLEFAKARFEFVRRCLVREVHAGHAALGCV